MSKDKMFISNNNVSMKLMDYERLVKFQGEIMEKMYAPEEELFYLVCSHANCSSLSLIYCDESGTVQCDIFDKKKNHIQHDIKNLNAQLGQILQIKKEFYVAEEIPDAIKEYMGKSRTDNIKGVTVFSGEVNHGLYSAILCHRNKGNIEYSSSTYEILINNLRMCVENRIFHEIVFYESSHDLLTKLYNRRCYFNRCEKEYPLLASIGIFFFDVNNLKKVNDNFGHDAGDMLLKKAADSIRSLTNENIHAYRMGGDEFILVAMNCTKSDINEIIQKWEEKLNHINNTYGGDPCEIAVGTAFGKGSFEIEELCKIADKRMYKDKMNKKYKKMGS